MADPSCSPGKSGVPAYCHGSLGWTDPEKGITEDYRFGDDGGLLKTVQSHVGRPRNTDPDTAELYDAGGKLLEKIAYQYDRDGNGNWTRRTISAWDATANTMVPIAVDQRQITYY